MIKKKDGSAIVEVTVLFSIILIMILSMYVTMLGIIKTESEMVSDDLICSELAIYKHIDMDELGKSENLDTLIITDYESAFTTFTDYLKMNLNLKNTEDDSKDSFLPSSKDNFINGKVSILDFNIYNVKDNDVNMVTYESGDFKEKPFPNGKGSVTTPKGNIVTNTTIYVKIGFKVKSIFNSSQEVTVAEESDILKD